MAFFTQERRRSWAILALRLVIGLGFMVHGIAKWSHDPANFGKLLQQIGTAANADGLANLLGFAVDHSKRSAHRFDAGSAVHGQHLARIAVRGFAQRARFFVLEFNDKLSEQREQIAI
jgi:uncharacterized membrane protein YphA (DoxX/SURF4 family)